MAFSLFILYMIFTLVMLYKSYNPVIWDIASVLYIVFATIFLGFPILLGLVLWVIIIAVIIIHQIADIRFLLSDFIYKKVKNKLPTISKTEELALNAGDTWFEESIFRGEPALAELKKIVPKLTTEEENFINNEVNHLCFMLDDWSIHEAKDMPQEIWRYIKEQGFLGLVIPKKYNGKGFSALAHSEIVMKIASRSSTAAVSVMVPNSLGPAELLLHYGTDEQKQYYLPRLAKGEEVPCFALTEPEAGSDATSIGSNAIVVSKNIKGKEIIGLSISLDKRWITLAPIATLLGVAVDLRDPNGLLANVGEEGITCVLIPRETKNLVIGNRHLPAYTSLMNGTIRGEDIFVPISNIIGGQKNAGRGWEMLVECLSIGRSISLPALSAAVSSVSYLTSGAFSCIRQQFKTDIGQFEGIKEKLAEIAGLTYLVNATRLLTLAAVDAQKKPSVASAITKYFTTEIARQNINHAMDIHGGRAVVLGPRNYLMDSYSSIPIFITVEGANIMTRNLLIFGQGAIAAHPFLRGEMAAIREEDGQKFHDLIWQHISYFCRNFAKAVCSSWTKGFFIKVSEHSMQNEYRTLVRLSHNYALLADLCLIYLGGELKRKERLSARLADGMGYLYMASAALHYASDIANNQDVKLHAEWASKYCFAKAQKSMLDLCENFPGRWFGGLIKFILFPFGQDLRLVDDKIDNRLATLMMENNEYRKQLLQDIYVVSDPLARVEDAYQLIIANRDLYKKIAKFKRYKLDEIEKLLKEEVSSGKLSKAELEIIMNVERARREAITVDEFSHKL